MSNKVNQYKLTCNKFTAELDTPLNRELRTLVTAEVDIYDVGTPTNEDGTVNEVYKCKLNGITVVKQGDAKPLLAKNKRSNSQRMRMAILKINNSDGYYERFMPKLIDRIEEVVEMIENT